MALGCGALCYVPSAWHSTGELRETTLAVHTKQSQPQALVSCPQDPGGGDRPGLGIMV